MFLIITIPHFRLIRPHTFRMWNTITGYKPAKPWTKQIVDGRAKVHYDESSSKDQHNSKNIRDSDVPGPSNLGMGTIREPKKMQASSEDDRPKGIRLERKRVAQIADLEGKLTQGKFTSPTRSGLIFANISWKAQERIAVLEQKVLRQQKEITLQKDELFKVRPMEQVTDAQISEKYNFLCESVRSWIDGEVSAFEEKGGDLRELNGITREHIFYHILQLCPDSLECLVEGQIHMLIQGTILAPNRQLFGLDPWAAEIIGVAACGLYNLDPPRGRKENPLVADDMLITRN